MGNKSKDAGPDPKKQRPPQEQERQPGRQSEMIPQPVDINPDIKGSNLLKGRAALITGGDSGIGRATALAFAREGADVAIVYLEEHQDAKATAAGVEEKGRKCLLISGDVGDAEFCKKAVKKAAKQLGKLDILVNNSAEQHPCDSIEDITPAQLERTFKTNLFSMFHLTAAALPHLRKSDKGAIINTTSVTAYRGSPGLLDYSASKGAIVSFTRSLSSQLAKEKIRVNAVAPGPIWTPLIPASFPAERVAEFGSGSPLGRAGQPWECAECFVFLAADTSAYITGQVLHPNGGEIING